jgi:hypothetical protein
MSIIKTERNGTQYQRTFERNLKILTKPMLNTKGEVSKRLTWKVDTDMSSASAFSHIQPVLHLKMKCI